jgi:hypothetical protein
MSYLKPSGSASSSASDGSMGSKNGLFPSPPTGACAFSLGDPLLATPSSSPFAHPAHSGRRWLYVQVAFLLLYLLRTRLFHHVPFLLSPASSTHGKDL